MNRLNEMYGTTQSMPGHGGFNRYRCLFTARRNNDPYIAGVNQKMVKSHEDEAVRFTDIR